MKVHTKVTGQGRQFWSCGCYRWRHNQGLRLWLQRFRRWLHRRFCRGCGCFPPTWGEPWI